MTTVINLFGGPCTGKSETAAGLYYELSLRRHSVELVREYVKSWTFNSRQVTESSGIYFLGKQAEYESILYNKVDFIVTDSPILLAGMFPIYRHNLHYVSDAAQEFMRHAGSQGVQYKNFVLTRGEYYSTVGRWETKEEAEQFDKFITGYLNSNSFDYTEVRKKPHQDEETCRYKVTNILTELGLY
jgi:hypothetical protein